jgi:hypothetical protein
VGAVSSTPHYFSLECLPMVSVMGINRLKAKPGTPGPFAALA